LIQPAAFLVCMEGGEHRPDALAVLTGQYL
jgi:hypothetical protein